MELIGILHGQNAELKVLNPFVRTYADHWCCKFKGRECFDWLNNKDCAVWCELIKEENWLHYLIRMDQSWV